MLSSLFQKNAYTAYIILEEPNTTVQTWEKDEFKRLALADSGIKIKETSRKHTISGKNKEIVANPSHDFMALFAKGNATATTPRKYPPSKLLQGIFGLKP